MDRALPGGDGGGVAARPGGRAGGDGGAGGGTLSDPDAATDGSSSSNGAITLSGSPEAVTAALDGLRFTPALGQFGTTTFGIAGTDQAGLTATATVAVTVNPPLPPTAAQLGQLGADVLKFYKDDMAHQPTAADAGRLAGDLTTLDPSPAEVGQWLGQALRSTMPRAARRARSATTSPPSMIRSWRPTCRTPAMGWPPT